MSILDYYPNHKDVVITALDHVLQELYVQSVENQLIFEQMIQNADIDQPVNSVTNVVTDQKNTSLQIYDIITACRSRMSHKEKYISYHTGAMDIRVRKIRNLRTVIIENNSPSDEDIETIVNVLFGSLIRSSFQLSNFNLNEDTSKESARRYKEIFKNLQVYSNALKKGFDINDSNHHYPFDVGLQ